ncbi:MAG: class I SAM-dependent methyltransferase [Cytophagaceae bacterium]|nr:class I SAM-dependent methyltransferase [Cytophagaceae bacterium]
MVFGSKNVGVKEDFKKAYDDQYNSESGVWRGLGALKKAKNILEITSGKTFDKVLEIGAGDGSILKILSENNFANEYYALEISQSGIQKISSKKIKNLKLAKEFDGYLLPFENQSFDLVVLSHVLEHVEHERILLREINRVAKAVVIEVPKDYRFGADKKIKHFLSYGHINIYTPTSLKFLLISENFKILKSKEGLYSKETYLVGKKTIAERFLGYLEFFIKKLLTNTPLEYINHKFINTIVILAEPEKNEINIF